MRTIPGALLSAIPLRLLKSMYDRAYVTSTSLTVFPGCAGSIEHAILCRVCDLFAVEGPAPIHVSVVPLRTGLTVPHVESTSGDQQLLGEGTIAVCRYLGRLHRFHPLDPSAAVTVDSALELLGEVLAFLGTVENPARMFAPETDLYNQIGWFRTVYIPGVLLRLDAFQYRATGESNAVLPWLGGMDAQSIADVCWAAALQWICDKYHVDVHASTELVHVTPWLCRALVCDRDRPGDSDASDDDGFEHLSTHTSST